MNRKKCIAIIPARGGSKRIPKKNIKHFLGKPIIAYSIEAALQSKLFEKIVVSTDCKKIADISRQFGAEVPFLRPKELSDDFASSGDAVAFTLNKLQEDGEKFDYYCILYATAPFLSKEYLIKGYEEIIKNNALQAFSCTSMPYPIQRTFKITDNGRCEMFWPENFPKRSQDLEQAYCDAGQFYWINPHYDSNEIGFSKDLVPIILPRYLVQDIDTLEDWKRAELMYQVLFQDKFDEWNNVKKKIEKKDIQIKFSQGNIYFMSVGQNIGYEVYGKKDLFLRPVLVYRKLSSETFIGIPLTSKQKEGNYYFTFKYTSKTLSTALLNQIRVFDIKRAEYYDGYINLKDFTKLRDKVKELINITPNHRRKGNGHASKKLPKDTVSISKETRNVK